MPNSEIRNCQNCKQNFVIEPEDFEFYEKMKVPAPTFCPECRFQRRLMFRNERNLYRRKCDLCGKDILTVYSPDKPYKVYCNSCWWSDKWDGLEYGQDYDPNRNFFEQFKELLSKTPYMALVVDYPTLINSEYVNHAGWLKNCYLVFNADHCENVYYARAMDKVKDSMDLDMVVSSEMCYEAINCDKCSRVFFSEDCSNCYDIYFSKELIGCNNCFGCANLRNKSYHIFNKPYSKEEYKQKLKEYGIDSFSSLEQAKKETTDFWRQNPHKFRHALRNVNSSGDYVFESKNAQNVYQAHFIEDGKWTQFTTVGPIKDVYDYTEWGNGAQRIYDCITVGEGVDNIKFSYACWKPNTMNIEYSFYTLASSNIFGCANIRNKKFCILNKQYTEEEYKKLREKIIQGMNENPYTDIKDRVFKYGEFFPYDLSLYGYNESFAMNYFSLTQEEVLAKGFHWSEQPCNKHKISLKASELPDSINEAEDSIINEIIECANCGKAFRIIKPELELLRKFNFPLPRQCQDCRYKIRLGRINPPRLWDRKCAKCQKDIKTSYAPARPEIVYCEKCYQQEVA